MPLRGNSRWSSCEPFTATTFSVPKGTNFVNPYPLEGGGLRPHPRGGRFHLFVHLLVVPICSGKEDHPLGYHVGPRSQSSCPPAPSAPSMRGGTLFAMSEPAARRAKGVLGAGGWGCVGSVAHPVPFLLGGRGWWIAKGRKRSAPPVSWSPTGDQPTACILVAEIWADRVEVGLGYEKGELFPGTK